MLDQSLKDQLVSIFANLKSQYTLAVELNQSIAASDEMLALLEDVASTSDKINVTKQDGNILSFRILKDGIPASFTFRAIPNGHEFSTLLLAILNLDGLGKNLPDESVVKRIQALQGDIEITSYISLTCTNCPDVVQALNVISILNPAVKHTIIDGGINQQEVEALNIQAVPSVYLNGELLHVGRSGLGELLSKIEEKSGSMPVVTEKVYKQYDAVIAGGGPAGVSAAIYLVRKGLSVAIVADHIGGQVTETVGIENMISMAYTTGASLSASLKEHLRSYPVDILENRKIVAASVKDGIKTIETSLGEVIESPALVIATGASWRRLGVPGENEYIGSGVAFCAHCDGPFYKNKKVVVVGGGNSGLEAAIDLSATSSEVIVLEFLPELKGDQVLQDKINNFANISVITNAQTLSVEGDGSKVNALKYKDRATDEVHVINTDGIFVQIGLKPNSQLFSDLVEVNKFGEIVIDAHGRTSVPGIYAAGDVTIVPFKQIVIAMGEGAKAGLTAFEDRMKDKLK